MTCRTENNNAKRAEEAHEHREKYEDASSAQDAPAEDAHEYCDGYRDAASAQDAPACWGRPPRCGGESDQRMSGVSALASRLAVAVPSRLGGARIDAGVAAAAEAAARVRALEADLARARCVIRLLLRFRGGPASTPADLRGGLVTASGADRALGVYVAQWASVACR